MIGRIGLIAAVDLAHQENLISIALLRERFTHPLFTASLVVIPAVIHEGNAAIDRLVNQVRGAGLRKRPFTDMRAAESDSRHGLARATELSVEHFAP